jgi:hypothetical protein
MHWPRTSRRRSQPLHSLHHPPPILFKVPRRSGQQFRSRLRPLGHRDHIQRQMLHRKMSQHPRPSRRHHLQLSHRRIQRVPQMANHPWRIEIPPLRLRLRPHPPQPLHQRLPLPVVPQCWHRNPPPQNLTESACIQLAKKLTTAGQPTLHSDTNQKPQPGITPPTDPEKPPPTRKRPNTLNPPTARFTPPQAADTPPARTSMPIAPRTNPKVTPSSRFGKLQPPNPKNNKPQKPSERQVHPTASSVGLSHRYVYTIRFRLHAKVTVWRHFGKTHPQLSLDRTCCALSDLLTHRKEAANHPQPLSYATYTELPHTLSAPEHKPNSSSQKHQPNSPQPERGPGSPHSKQRILPPTRRSMPIAPRTTPK